MTHVRTPVRHDAGVIAVVAFAHGTSHFFQLVLPSLFPWLMRDFGLDFTGVGLAMTAFFVVSGLGQAAAGFAVDRFGAFRVLCAGLACLGVAALLVAVAQGLAGLVLAALVAGAGNAVFHPADFSLLNRKVSEGRLGHAFSAHGLSGSLGWALAPVFVVGLATTFGWRWAAVGAAVVALLAIVGLVAARGWLADGAERAATRRAGGAQASSFDFLGVPAVWLCFLFFFFTTMAFGAFQNYGTPLLQALFDLTLAAAASGITAFLLAAAGGMFLGGFIAARYAAHDRLVAVFLGGAALIAVILAAGVLPTAAALPALAGIGFCTGVAGPSRDILVRRAAVARFGAGAYGRIYGLVYSGIDAGMALAPLAFGPLMDSRRFWMVMAGVAVLQIGAVVVALAAARRAGGAAPAAAAA
ncbi:putative fosmidomycin resistance protein [Azoarcus olearius]|uniref:MFS transporter n=1 Tax=Azoarcus sp. (strain BH72) TaxID=418699 RepID=UPI0008061424|nr:MFS transporter [Azoarcus olearius]ANQ85764.1 putative fosmidomycin resistance protein [Azoarcus olearius]